jgi:hypothetical protein
MDLTQPVDLYCERLGPGLWAEPFNAVSNAAFFLSALFVARGMARQPQKSPAALRLLPLLIAVIGVGSILFHTLAVRWTEWADVLCIAVFIHYFVVCFLHYCAGLRWTTALLGIPGFMLFGRVVTLPFAARAFNGSVDYFPALAGILSMGLYAALRGRGAWFYFGAAAILALSLTLRTGDRAWCQVFPLGTHWLWHCLNAVTLALATSGLLRSTLDARPAPEANTQAGR